MLVLRVRMSQSYFVLVCRVGVFILRCRVSKSYSYSVFAVRDSLSLFGQFVLGFRDSVAYLVFRISMSCWYCVMVVRVGVCVLVLRASMSC